MRKGMLLMQLLLTAASKVAEVDGTQTVFAMDMHARYAVDRKQSCAVRYMCVRVNFILIVGKQVSCFVCPTLSRGNRRCHPQTRASLNGQSFVAL